jgi:hypothetical protein
MIRTTVVFLRRPCIDCSPGVVVLDLKTKKLVNGIQSIGLGGLLSAGCGRLPRAPAAARVFSGHRELSLPALV